MRKEYYSDNIENDIDDTIKNNPLYKDWYSIVNDILKNEEFQKRKIFMHHYNITVWQHSVLVSFNSYVLAKKWKADERVCAIAGLLHDFYPWTWIYDERLEKLDHGYYLRETKVKHSLFKKHGFTHAKAAALNYVEFFPELEDKKITNCIERHMFPLNIIPPKYKEGVIVTLVDKMKSFHELPDLSYYPKMVKNQFKKINKIGKFLKINFIYMVNFMVYMIFKIN